MAALRDHVELGAGDGGGQAAAGVGGLEGVELAGDDRDRGFRRPTVRTGSPCNPWVTVTKTRS